MSFQTSTSNTGQVISHFSVHPCWNTHLLFQRFNYLQGATTCEGSFKPNNTADAIKMFQVSNLFLPDENNHILFSLVALSSVRRLDSVWELFFLFSFSGPWPEPQIEILHIHSFKGNPKCHKLKRLLSIKFS